ncbi:MAG: hypothetical protein ACYDH9_01085 [Limisphaerales bacterium]
MPDPAPKAELMHSLGRLVRGLSALFWGLPLTLVISVQTARTDWFKQLGVIPPLAATGLLFYGLWQLGHFQKQERVWRNALDLAKALAVINIGLSPFLSLWNKLPNVPFFFEILCVLVLTGLLFLLHLNRVLQRLTAMLPDEALRQETKLFTSLNLYLLMVTLVLVLAYFVLAQMHSLPRLLIQALVLVNQGSLWLLIFLVLLPTAMTMALIWKIKEVILESVFTGAPTPGAPVNTGTQAR